MNRNPDYRSIDAAKAKELLKSGRAKPSKGSGLIDMPSLVASLGTFALIVILVAVYIELFMLAIFHCKPLLLVLARHTLILV